MFARKRERRHERVTFHMFGEVLKLTVKREQISASANTRAGASRKYLEGLSSKGSSKVMRGKTHKYSEEIKSAFHHLCHQHLGVQS